MINIKKVIEIANECIEKNTRNITWASTVTGIYNSRLGTNHRAETVRAVLSSTGFEEFEYYQDCVKSYAWRKKK